MTYRNNRIGFVNFIKFSWDKALSYWNPRDHRSPVLSDWHLIKNKQQLSSGRPSGSRFFSFYHQEGNKNAFILLYLKESGLRFLFSEKHIKLTPQQGSHLRSNTCIVPLSAHLFFILYGNTNSGPPSQISQKAFWSKALSDIIQPNQAPDWVAAQVFTSHWYYQTRKWYWLASITRLGWHGGERAGPVYFKFALDLHNLNAR